MRHSPLQPPNNSNRADWQTLRSLIPYLMEFKWRVIVAMSLLIFSKLANVSVPLVLKEIIDAMDKTKSVLIIPVFLIVGYGVLLLKPNPWSISGFIQSSPPADMRIPANKVRSVVSLLSLLEFKLF